MYHSSDLVLQCIVACGFSLFLPLKQVWNQTALTQHFQGQPKICLQLTCLPDLWLYGDNQFKKDLTPVQRHHWFKSLRVKVVLSERDVWKMRPEVAFSSCWSWCRPPLSLGWVSARAGMLLDCWDVRDVFSVTCCMPGEAKPATTSSHAVGVMGQEVSEWRAVVQTSRDQFT